MVGNLDNLKVYIPKEVEHLEGKKKIAGEGKSHLYLCKITQNLVVFFSFYVKRIYMAK